MASFRNCFALWEPHCVGHYLLNVIMRKSTETAQHNLGQWILNFLINFENTEVRIKIHVCYKCNLFVFTFFSLIVIYILTNHFRSEYCRFL